jgi:hypothetical protein
MRPRTFQLAIAASLVALVGPGAAVAQPAADKAAPAAGQQETQPSLEVLLERFPFGTGQVRTGGPAAQGADAANTDDDSGASGLFWILLAVWTGTIVLLTAFGVRAVRRRRAGGSEASSIVSTPPVSSSDHESERSPGVTEPAQDRDGRQPGAEVSSEAPARKSDGPGGHEGDYDEVSKGVAGILEAAEVAADEIRAQAVEAAAGIRKAAEDEARVLLAKAEQEAAKVREAADQSTNERRAAFDAELEGRRKQVEEQAQRMLADARAQAGVLHEAAAERAKQVEQAARERQDALRAQAKPLEDNVQRAIETFRGLGVELESLLADVSGRANLSLVDDLNESARTAEARADRSPKR